ncbi:MAG TPA: helix-turn-helix transcriptional regulator [Devosia sp.]|nr:helix-turn-helix transcriptional regulator [Devosia sp.]
MGPIRRIESEPDARSVLAQIASLFGFRSAFLIEYAPDFSTPRHIIDTNAARGAGWAEMFRREGLGPGIKGIRTMLEMDMVVRLKPERFEPDHPYKAFAHAHDLGETVAVPISQGETIAGLVSFSGWPTLTRQDETALQLLSYMLFAELRAREAKLPPSAEPALPALTPREKEVMRLSAVGLTSVEIADRLGMSPRTVNQHVDNVADKLGTRNRTHTIAELMRHDMLN